MSASNKLIAAITDGFEEAMVEILGRAMEYGDTDVEAKIVESLCENGDYLVIEPNCPERQLAEAAPDLLEALRGMVEQVEVLNAQAAFGSDLEAARAAISKATKGRDQCSSDKS